MLIRKWFTNVVVESIKNRCGRSRTRNKQKARSVVEILEQRRLLTISPIVYDAAAVNRTSGGGKITFTIGLTEASTSSTTVTVTTLDDTANSTDDYYSLEADKQLN